MNVPQRNKPAFTGKHAEITEQILRAFYEVYGALGYGFAEKVYENAMGLEMINLGLQVQQQSPMPVYYRDQLVGEYFADLLVNNLVIVELKAVQQLLAEHEAQVLNYLKATRIEVGLLLNFGPKAQTIRKTYDNERKGSLEWTKRMGHGLEG